MTMTNCAWCKKRFEKKHPSQRFCCLHHKDKYHNLHNPRGYGLHPVGIHGNEWLTQYEDDNDDWENCGYHNND